MTVRYCRHVLCTFNLLRRWPLADLSLITPADYVMLIWQPENLGEGMLKFRRFHLEVPIGGALFLFGAKHYYDYGYAQVSN